MADWRYGIAMIYALALLLAMLLTGCQAAPSRPPQQPRFDYSVAGACVREALEPRIAALGEAVTTLEVQAMRNTAEQASEGCGAPPGFERSSVARQGLMDAFRIQARLAQPWRDQYATQAIAENLRRAAERDAALSAAGAAYLRCLLGSAAALASASAEPALTIADAAPAGCVEERTALARIDWRMPDELDRQGRPALLARIIATRDGSR